MTSTLKFSVVTVCFNSAATIADSLKSVAAQTWPAIEHIVIDGGSTDATLDIIEPFRAGLGYLRSERDHGIYDAMNKGVAAATGDVVCFLNSDDMYASEDVLARVASKIGPMNLDALYGDVGYFRTGAPERTTRRYSSRSFHPDRLAYGMMPAHPALFLRRSIFERVGEFRRDYRIAGDFEFIARVFKQPIAYVYLPEILVKMRIGGISTAGWQSRILLNREILQACRDNGISTNVFKLAARYPMKALELYRR